MQTVSIPINSYKVRHKRVISDTIKASPVFKQVDEIDHSLVSIRTKDALEQVKSTGKRLGRPKGSESKLFFLDAHKGEIMNMLERGESVGSICEHFNVSKNTFYKYRKKFFRS